MYKRNWLEARYYTDAPVSPIAAFMAAYIALRMRGAIRKGNITPFG